MTRITSGLSKGDQSVVVIVHNQDFTEEEIQEIKTFISKMKKGKDIHVLPTNI